LTLLTWTLWSIAALVFGGGAWFAYASWREAEVRATRVALIGAIIAAAPFVAAALLPGTVQTPFGIGLLALTILALFACIWPDRPEQLPRRLEPVERIDERDIMFSRRELEPGSEKYERYYRRHPGRREVDERWRAKPGLMGPGSRYEHPLGFASAEATFRAVDALQPFVEGEPEGEPRPRDPEAAREFVCGWARELGAVDAGVAQLNPRHVYTVGGRGERYDSPIQLDHPFAIAFTVEMDYRMMQSAPAAPTLMESAQQYLNAGSIAVQLAVAIREMGYRARAHIDGNYQVICPLVARDAGLGEIGRMGLLMTPRHGPRVRIGVVTTDMPLAASPEDRTPAVEDFCRLCKKCAKVCPSQAIPYGDRGDRWRIDSEACFTYWCEAGTDCGRCMIACPYAHPDSGVHRLVRGAIRRSPLLRRAAVALDDLAYGVRPKPKPLPEWMDSPD